MRLTRSVIPGLIFLIISSIRFLQVIGGKHVDDKSSLTKQILFKETNFPLDMSSVHVFMYACMFLLCMYVCVYINLL